MMSDVADGAGTLKLKKRYPLVVLGLPNLEDGRKDVLD
jgi:hypothetical protein